MLLKDALFLERGAKSTALVTPELVLSNPTEALLRLVDGYFWLHTTQFHPLNDKHFFNNAENLFKTGIYAYNVLVVMPGEFRQRYDRITLFELEGSRLSLSQVPVENKVYKSMHVPSLSSQELTRHAAIYGGLVQGDAPLEELFTGDKAAQIIEEVNKQKMERRRLKDFLDAYSASNPNGS